MTSVIADGDAAGDYLNLGLRADFLLRWLKAYFIAWPVAAITGFLVMPSARRLSERIVRRIEARR
jgi:hypothetical protein